ncbi:EVE domain-containing protein [Prochlorococcus sp. MIT 1341]|uniref:EVE domain-containing protein n=1 Tax=Prochlorococcus sp. MIT 1341 TaxID=3096221 RepID=UPI002A761956|nr:EVE domain-containing protein [Prochlorococcus sp. MIT 1341]
MTEINYWLMKSEPEVYGINHLKEEVSTLWDGIRNYQARNFMRRMSIGDKAFFYHSNCKPPGIVGLMEVLETGLIDPTQFDPNAKYYDPKSSQENPRWDCNRMGYICQFEKKLTIEELRASYSAEQLTLLRKGNRLSIMPIHNKIAIEIISRLGGVI